MITDGTAKAGWLKAPNGKPTNLDPVQWVQVRTSAFKAWFGDWEKKAKLAAIDALAPITVTERNESISAEEAYKALGEGENETDGRRVKFVNSTLGKIIRHKGFNTSRIVHQLKEIFAKSVPVATDAEKEIVRSDGTVHKRHPNLVGYHTYIGKIADEASTYYVRFTVQEERTRQKGYNPNAVHSTFVSDVAIYNSGKALSQSTTTVGESELSRTDNILSNILADFNRASSDCSKVVDENGEPLVVYHYGLIGVDGLTEEDLPADAKSAFVPTANQHFGTYRQAAHRQFQLMSEGAWQSEHGEIKQFFLNIRKPKKAKDGWDCVVIAPRRGMFYVIKTLFGQKENRTRTKAKYGIRSLRFDGAKPRIALYGAVSRQFEIFPKRRILYHIRSPPRKGAGRASRASRPRRTRRMRTM